MKIKPRGFCAVLAISLAGAWVASAGAGSTGPEAGAARPREEVVVESPPAHVDAELFGRSVPSAPWSPEERKQWLIDQKLELARRAVAAAEAAGTRELNPHDLENNVGQHSESDEKKLDRLAQMNPSSLPGLPGATVGQSGAIVGQPSEASVDVLGVTSKMAANDPRALSVGTATDAELAVARAAADEELPQGCLEGRGRAQAQAFANSAYCQGGGFLTDDTCHYARGTTMILHVFVNHGALTWSSEERGASIAKSNLAKDWYRAESPANAYMRFDHDDTGIGYYIMCNLPAEIPDPGSHGWVNDVCAALGFADDDGDGHISDEFTIWYQDQYGGWDNVIAVFQPADVFFTATASAERGACKIPPSASWQTWAHEWGHCFGSNDEYGNCNGYGCGDISQSCYLTDDVPNGNCESDPCGSSISCMMKANSSTVPPCSYTQRHWAWIDENDNGLLDTTLWNDNGDAYNLYELFHNGYFIHTDTDWGMVANQRWESWSVIGLRARSTAAYDLHVYGDNNYRNLQASSTGHSANYVNYVVGDFNRNHLGQDFIDIRKSSGSGQYVLTYESGTGMLFPDGVDRPQTWEDYNVVRAFDVPLFGGEIITFDLDIMTAGLDLGMALYKSNPGGGTTPYYVGRTSGADQWEADSWGAGIGESFTFTVPQDDVYGLIVWSNNELDGDWEIKIGPTPYTLAEETPHTSFLDLRLYNYVPTPNYWAVAAVRPQAATNVSLSLFAESTYATELGTSSHYADVEFVAADYHDGSSADYLRVQRVSGVGSFTTEWEQGTEVLNGFEPGNWGSTHIAKVWDTYLLAGTTYFFRLYGGAPPYADGSIYLMSSAGGDNFVQRILRVAESNTHPASAGEWFTYTPAATDWYGFVMVTQDDAGGNNANFTVGMGPRVSLAENVPDTHADEVVWDDVSVVGNAWSVVGIRAAAGVTAQVSTWDCSNYATSCFMTTDLQGGGVTFIALDGYELGAATIYPRVERKTGSGNVTASFDASGEPISWDGDSPVESAVGTWAANEVAQATDLYVRARVDNLFIEVTPLVAGMDLGVAVVRNFGGDPALPSFESIVSANDQGAGGVEVVELAPSTGTYGLIVTNQNGVAGGYRIEVSSELPTSDVAGDTREQLHFQVTGANPSSRGASFALFLPTRDHVGVSIFDVRGRLVRAVADATMEPGVHALTWDGRDEQGRGVVAGMYLARLETTEEKRTVKVVRAE